MNCRSCKIDIALNDINYVGEQILGDVHLILYNCPTCHSTLAIKPDTPEQKFLKFLKEQTITQE